MLLFIKYKMCNTLQTRYIWLLKCLLDDIDVDNKYIFFFHMQISNVSICMLWYNLTATYLKNKNNNENIY